MYKRQKKVHLTTSAVKIGYKHLWNSKFNFWMLPHPFLIIRERNVSSAVSENTEKKTRYSSAYLLFGQVSSISPGNSSSVRYGINMPLITI